MKCFIGIDLGSTTTKAVILGRKPQRIGAWNYQLTIELRHCFGCRETGGDCKCADELGRTVTF